MSSNFIFPEWLNANSVRAYPIAESATRLDVTGNARLPDSLIVDARISVHPDFASHTFFVSRIALSPEGADIRISCLAPAPGSQAIEIGGISAPASSGNYKPYSFVGSGDVADISGTIVVGDLWLAAELAGGVFEFVPEASKFEHTVLNVSQPQVRAIEVYSGNSRVGIYNGLLKLKAGRNIRLSYVDATTIRIDAIDGLNTTDPDACENAVPLGPPIRTINGVGPDSNGAFRIDGGECVSVEPGGANALTIKDLCSKSCCGCDELQQLVDGLRDLEAEYKVMKANLYTVQANTSMMLANITAALA